ncbi:MAG: bifunctional folylpolyglutamate synthase/dihydrofolate synthase [Acidimicrobiia bacterium]|nr:bifunctional folylpolyglutamate synthase/dihydrofolate synthase [Acidimicrobiia bacterium]
MAALDAHTNLGVGPGLERMTAAMDLLGSPQTAAPVIHVTGTNGKTSVARIVARILEGNGLSTLLYTSPHLTEVYERIELSGVPISPETFADIMGRMLPVADEVERRVGTRPTYFELGTCLAFTAGADAAVDVQVLEVGLGGRYDATNVADADVAVLTNVSVDHAAYLGTDVADICREKAGIVKAGSGVVTGVGEASLVAILEDACAVAGARALRRLGDDIVLDNVRPAHAGVAADLRSRGAAYENLYVPLLGHHQAVNLALAVAAVEEFFGRPCDEETLRESLFGVTSPGRLEVMAHRPAVVLDGAHNPEGARVLAEALRENFTYESLVWVAGILGDKDAEGIVAAIAPSASHVVTTSAGDAFHDPEDLADLVRRTGTAVTCEKSPEGALLKALATAGDADLVLVAGSLYLVGSVRPHLVTPRGAPE